MPIEHLRILTVLVTASAVAAILSGDLGMPLFLCIIAANLPLYFDINIDQIRDNKLWRAYGIATFFVVGLLFWAGLPVKVPIFMLVLFCIVYEYYGEKRRNAPARLIGLLSFLVLLYQARVESGLNLMLGVAIYFFAVVWTLYAFHAAKLYGYGFFELVRRSIRPVSGLTLLVGALGIFIFWTLPRFPDQSLGTIPSLNGNRLSGFGDRVTLSDIGSLKLSRKHVMDLKPLDGQLHTRYLRGRSLDSYQNGIWENTLYLPYFPRRQDGVYELREEDGPTYQYQIDLEPMFGNVIFFPDTLVKLEGIPQAIKVIGATDNITSPSPVPLALSYTATASDQPLRISRNASISHYLRIPKSLDYLRDFTRDIIDLNTSQIEQADAIRAHLEANYLYSLEINNQGSQDPLYNFLFESRKGHCELFASAMALMCRSQGIPSRIVTGFYIPEVHPSGAFHYITESDAHAWVEVLVNGFWVRFDPTPTANFSTPGFAESQLAYMRHFWRNKIMGWSAKDQQELLETGSRMASSIRITIGQNTKAFIVAMLAVILLIQLLRTKITNRLAALQRIYRNITRIMEKQVGKKPPTIGMLAFARQGTWPPETQTALLRFLKTYQAYRFGKNPSSDMLPSLVSSGKALIKMLKETASKDP